MVYAITQNNFFRSYTARVGAVFVFAVICYSLPLHRAHAEFNPQAPLVVSDTGHSFGITSDLLTSWKGQYKLKRASLLVGSNQSFTTLVGAYILGQRHSSPVSLQTYQYDPSAIYNWVVSKKPEVDTQIEEGSLEIEDGRATEFVPPVAGTVLDAYTTTFNILEALASGSATADLAVSTTQPQHPLSSLNNLGITELIARGESNFKGSPKNRRINIDVGVEKFKGVIIMPGEEFSFNKFLGPVEKEFGFVPELVIKAEGTIPELGGGLCQVSSTTFRAAMQAGLPITARRNHAYAVQYYAPQGTDATIYPGVQDLKFTNDTPGAILIWPYLKDKDDLVFDFYGTKDSRQVVLEKPIQFDRKSDGSLKASWTRIVTKDGTPRTDVFKSTYRSPALYHKQEQFVSSTPAPTTTGTPTTPETAPTPPTTPPQPST